MNFEKPKKLLKIGALLLLSSLPAFGQSKDASIEDLKQLSKDKEKEIVLQVAEHGRKYTTSSVNMGVLDYTENIKKMILPNSRTEITIGYDLANKEQWLMGESEDGQYVLLDENMDGEIDRFVLNDEVRKKKFYMSESEFQQELKEYGETFKMAKKSNSKNTAFTPIDFLTKEARITRSDDKKIFVYQIERFIKDCKVKIVDFSSGETIEVTGSEAKEEEKQLQKIFLDFLNFN